MATSPTPPPMAAGRAALPLTGGRVATLPMPYTGGTLLCPQHGAGVQGTLMCLHSSTGPGKVGSGFRLPYLVWQIRLGVPAPPHKQRAKANCEAGDAGGSFILATAAAEPSEAAYRGQGETRAQAWHSPQAVAPGRRRALSGDEWRNAALSPGGRKPPGQLRPCPSSSAIFINNHFTKEVLPHGKCKKVSCGCRFCSTSS